MPGSPTGFPKGDGAARRPETMINQTLHVALLLFPLSEIALAVIKRSRAGQARSEDRGSLRLLWLAIVVGVSLAFLASRVRSAHAPVPRSIVAPIALVLMVIGLGARWVAILTLGKLFTVDVAIHSDHSVVRSGLYRYMRHPSYTGLMTAFLGFGLLFDNWLCLIALLLPISLGVVNRVVKEEQALLSSLGSEYAVYCARTKRFIPGLF